jgi:hypothetical protein
MVDVSLYIDDANKRLWETMNQSFNISIDYSSEDCYGNYMQNGDCTIYVPRMGEPDAASFTHELLHLYLPYHKTFIGGAIEGMMKETYPLNIIFDKGLYDHISNSLEHIKMLPIYLKMGYPIEKFILDYYDDKLTDDEVDRLCQSYKKGVLCIRYNRMAINFLIGKFFAVKADINTDNHYDRQLAAMDKLDHELFSTLNDFWNGWIDYDIELKREAWENDYHGLVDNLVNDLTNWSKHKKFV